MPKPGLDLTTPDKLGIDIRRDVALAQHTTMKVGGAADYFAAVTVVEELAELVRWCRNEGLPYFVLGGGSNILISDRGVRGLVIYNRCRQVEVSAENGQPHLFTASGAAMAGVARTSIRAGLAGLAWAVSVPGTVGGAVVGNAGAHGGEIKDSLQSAQVLDETGTLKTLNLDNFDYAYRNSELKRRLPLQGGFKAVVLSATFRLDHGDPTALKTEADGYLAHRRRTQPVEPSLGSTFVNPPDDYAGRLIEAAGLKGARVGGVEVSVTHANFIVNPGGVGSATAQDVMDLIHLSQTTVKAQFGVALQREIQLAGDWSPDAVYGVQCV
jgi:UDP-N-acetylmuramate dehydrogenase